jgi:hypothetical protein
MLVVTLPQQGERTLSPQPLASVVFHCEQHRDILFMVCFGTSLNCVLSWL